MKLLIIESDLRVCRATVAKLRAECMELEVHVTADARGAFGTFQQLQPDVVLIDVAIAQRKGVELCRRIMEWSERTAVVMLGTHASDACAALDAGAIDFMMRPLEHERLLQALNKAQRQSQGIRSERLKVAETTGVGESYVAARLHGELKIIPVRDVRVFRAEDKYVTAIHSHGEDLIDESLCRLADRFSDGTFIRVHRNGLVAKRAIRSLRCTGRHQHSVLLNDGTELSVSRRHLRDVRRFLLERATAKPQGSALTH